jgi:hypothetical protein
MPTRRQVNPGESLVSIARENGLLPETIWNDPANRGLAARRKDLDAVQPGDEVVVPDRRKKEETAATEQKHRFRRKENRGLVIRLEMEPGKKAGEDDRFVLSGADGSYRMEKTVKDDQIPGDQYLDLHYSGLRPKKKYTLQAIPAGGGNPETVFENVPYEDLAGLSGQGQSEVQESSPSSPQGDAPYPDEPDEEAESGERRA